MTRTIYSSMTEFYADDERRARSPEVDFGCAWWEGATTERWSWPVYRVSYVRDTGEIYAVALRGSGKDQVEILGIVPPDDAAVPPSHERGEDFSPFRHTYYRTLDGILDGWPDHHDLEWVRSRLTQAGRGPEASREAMRAKVGEDELADHFDDEHGIGE